MWLAIHIKCCSYNLYRNRSKSQIQMVKNSETVLTFITYVTIFSERVSMLSNSVKTTCCKVKRGRRSFDMSGHP